MLRDICVKRKDQDYNNKSSQQVIIKIYMKKLK